MLYEQVHGVRLRKAEDRIKRLEETVARLIVREADKQRDAMEESRQRQIDEDIDLGCDPPQYKGQYKIGTL